MTRLEKLSEEEQQLFEEVGAEESNGGWEILVLRN